MKYRYIASCVFTRDYPELSLRIQDYLKERFGMQTMRTLADNMAWLLKKIHANGNPDYPEREEWLGMNFIR